MMLGLLGCQKEQLIPTPIQPTPTTPKLNILWKVPVLPDTSGHNTLAHTLVNGDVVFGTNFTLPSAFLQLRDGKTGAFKWKFDGFLYPNEGFLYNHVFAIQNKVIINDWHQTYCIDAASGNKEWLNNVGATGQGEPTATVIGDYVYKVNYQGDPPGTYTSSVVRTHYLSGRWDTLVTIAAKDSFSQNVMPPTLWVNPSGDSILIIQDNSLRDNNATPHEGRYDLVNLYAFNLRTRQYNWQREDFEDVWAASHNQPLVDGNRLYIQTTKAVCCVDLVTGLTLWRRNFDWFIQAGNPVQHQNLVIVQSDDQGLWGLDKMTGATVWYNPSTVGTVYKVQCFEGRVYFTSAGNSTLYCIDAANGKTIWAERSPNYSSRTPNVSFGWSGVVIDPERKVLFVSDNYYLMCIKLPEP